MEAPKKISLIELIIIMQKAEAMRQRVIALEQKQSPFAELQGITIRTQICVN